MVVCTEACVFNTFLHGKQIWSAVSFLLSEETFDQKRRKTFRESEVVSCLLLEPADVFRVSRVLLDAVSVSRVPGGVKQKQLVDVQLET